MALPLTINGQVFEYPQDFDLEWGVDATGWAQAVTAGALYLSGGNFPLTATVDFGSSFGLKAKSITSKTANPATAGYLLLAKTDAIEWRNNIGDANLSLAIDGSDNLTFNGSPLGTTSLTNAHIFVGNASNVPVAVNLSGDATITNTGAMTIANNAITNAKVSTSAAIATSKLAPLTVSRAIVSDSGGLLAVSAVTSTELGYSSGLSGNIQTQIGTLLPLAGGTMSGAISMASHKITSLTAGTTSGDAVAYQQLPGPAQTITNWTAWTPTAFGGFTAGNVSFWFRRVGDTAEIRGKFTSSSQSATVGSIDITALVSGNSARIATAKFNADANIQLVGRVDILDGTTYAVGALFYDGSDDTRIYFANSASSSQYAKRAANAFFGSGAISMQFAIPIAGWTI